jgi:hypothetical protein
MSSVQVALYGRCAHATAFLISFYALDVLVPMIDIFNLPLPRYVGSISFSAGAILAALVVLIPLARVRRVPLFGNAAFALAGVTAIWAGLEVIGTYGLSDTRFDLILEFVPLLLVLVASRLHLLLFDDPNLLHNIFILMASSIVFVHTLMLFFISFDMAVQFINVGELRGRNSMALIAPICLWILAFFPLKAWPVFGHRYNLLLLLALFSILLNSARTAFLILIWCILVGVLSRSPELRRRIEGGLFFGGFVVVVAVMSSYPILMALNELGLLFVEEGDHALSVWSRSQTNFFLLEKLSMDPLLGIGWSEVATTKAFGYMGHTLYVTILAACGVIGAFAATSVMAIGLLRASGYGRETAAHLLFLTMLIASFSNNVFGYFGLMIALVGSAIAQNVSQEIRVDDVHASKFI